MPRLSGELPGTKVLMLTAAALDDKVDGLALGADDYMTKPFRSPSWWRGCGRSAAAAAPRGRRCCAAGDFVLDPAARRRLAAGGPWS